MFALRHWTTLESINFRQMWQHSNELRTASMARMKESPIHQIRNRQQRWRRRTYTRTLTSCAWNFIVSTVACRFTIGFFYYLCCFCVAFGFEISKCQCSHQNTTGIELSKTKAEILQKDRNQFECLDWIEKREKKNMHLTTFWVALFGFQIFLPKLFIFAIPCKLQLLCMFFYSIFSLIPNVPSHVCQFQLSLKLPRYKWWTQ